jgi:hypothetical protein
VKTEPIRFFNREFQHGIDNCDWGSHLKREQMFITPELKKWVCVTPVQFKNEVEKFMEAIKFTSKAMNFLISPPLMIFLENNRTQTYANSIKQVVYLIFICS